MLQTIIDIEQAVAYAVPGWGKNVAIMDERRAEGRIWLLILALVLFAVAMTAVAKKTDDHAVREKLLGTVPPRISHVVTSVTHHGCRIAWVEPRGGNDRVVLDGRAEREYPGIEEAGPPVFSSDGKRLAYAAKMVSTLGMVKWFVVVDGRAGPQYGDVGGITFSPDGKRLAYAAKDRNDWCLVVDGKPGLEHDGIGHVVFSPDGKRIAYLARKGEAWSVVLGGQVGPQYDQIRGMLFSPDSRHLAYTARKKDRMFVVLGGQPGPQFHSIGERVFGRTLHEECEYAVGPVFSSDGRHLAYGATKDLKALVVLDGQPGPEYDGIWDIEFSPDGKRLAYRARTDDKWRVIVNGQPGPEHDWKLNPYAKDSLFFSPDSCRLAYTVMTRAGESVMVDAQPGPEFNLIVNWTLVFSPDSKRLAYVASKETNIVVVVVDGQPGPELERAGRPAFSLDSRHIAYAARKDGQWFVMVDGQPGPTYDRVLGGPVFRGDGTLDYIVRRGRSVYRVTSNVR